MYKYYFNKNVVKFLEKQDLKLINKIKEKIEILSQDPYNNNLDIKTYKGRKNSFRLRIGKYRFLYEIIEDKILIYFFDANTRGDIYK